MDSELRLDPELHPKRLFGAGPLGQSYTERLITDVMHTQHIVFLLKSTSLKFHHYSLALCSCRLEGRQPELVPAVLLPEHTEQEAVHAQQHATPQEHSKLLSPRVRNPRDLQCQRNCCKSQDTVDSGNDLALKTELVAKSTGKVADTTLAITLYVGRLANVVEHVAGGEKEDGDQRESSPEVAVLQERDDVGRGNGKRSDTSKDRGSDGDDLDPVDGARDLGLRDVGRELAGDPGMDLLSSLRAVWR